VSTALDCAAVANADGTVRLVYGLVRSLEQGARRSSSLRTVRVEHVTVDRAFDAARPLRGPPPALVVVPGGTKSALGAYPPQHAGDPRSATVFPPAIAQHAVAWAPGHPRWLAYGGAAGLLHFRHVPATGST